MTKVGDPCPMCGKPLGMMVDGTWVPMNGSKK